MRIFCAIRHSIDPNFYYGGLWSGNFYPALRRLGHEIVESKIDLLPASRFMDVPDEFTKEEFEVRARITQETVDEVRGAHRERPLDLLLSYFYNAHFEPAGFDEIHRLGIPSINFYCNSMYQFAWVAKIAAKAVFSWHPERDARTLYLKAGANPVWVQMGADPNVYHPVASVARQSKACFVGQRYADRDRWAAALIRAGLPLDLYGSGWGGDAMTTVAAAEKDPVVYLGRVRPRPGSARSYWQAAGQVVREEGLGRGAQRLVRQWHYRSTTRRLTPMLRHAAQGRAPSVAETFAGYEVVLNFSNVWADGRPGSPLIPHVRLRDFEAPMCRTCYLTGRTEEIQEFYEIGKEIDTYGTLEELVDKTRFYLKNRDEAEQLRNAAYLRATRDHTWVQRFKALFRKIGIDEASPRC